MPKIKIIRKNGKRYVKIGQKRVKVHKSMTERELLQWLVKHFTRRRRRKNKKEGDLILPSEIKPKVSVTYGVADDTRIQLRDLQNKLEESKKEQKDLQKQLTAPERLALPPGTKPPDADALAALYQASEHIHTQEKKLKELKEEVSAAEHKAREAEERENQALYEARKQKMKTDLDTMAGAATVVQSEFKAKLAEIIPSYRTAAELRRIAQEWDEAHPDDKLKFRGDSLAAKGEIKQKALLANKKMKKLITKEALTERALRENKELAKLQATVEHQVHDYKRNAEEYRKLFHEDPMSPMSDAAGEFPLQKVMSSWVLLRSSRKKRMKRKTRKKQRRNTSAKLNLQLPHAHLAQRNLNHPNKKVTAERKRQAKASAKMTSTRR